MAKYEFQQGEGSSDMRLPKRPLLQAMGKGFRCKCPNCGTGNLFSRYLKVEDTCKNCGEELHHHRADDAPPYFTITIVGHIVIPGLMFVERMYRPEIWVHFAIWIPLTIALCLFFLPLVKGAIIGLQWSNYMHGFNPNVKDHDDLYELPNR